MTLPLAGIKVLEICQVYAGPFAAQLMADQGAEVIKIEDPDSNQNLSTFGYLSFNHNKRHISLDIATPGGHEIVERLVRWADVMVINMRVLTRQRHSITYEDLRAVNPRLVYASITGYGEEGPEADLPGADITVQARVGDIDARTIPGNPPPYHTSFFHYDMATSMLVAYGVMLALWQRERTGRGDKIEANLLQTAIATQTIQMVRKVGVDEASPIQPSGLPQSYRCSDGRYILSQFISIAQRWDRLCKALGSEELADPRFASLEDRQRHIPEIQQILERTFLTKTAAEWEAHLHGQNHMMSMVHTIDEVFDDPQVVANNMFFEFQQPGVGPLRIPSRPITLEETADEPWFHRPVPLKGEHTDEVLRQLGLSDSEIGTLRENRTVA